MFMDCLDTCKEELQAEMYVLDRRQIFLVQPKYPYTDETGGGV